MSVKDLGEMDVEELRCEVRVWKGEARRHNAECADMRSEIKELKRRLCWFEGLLDKLASALERD